MDVRHLGRWVWIINSLLLLSACGGRTPAQKAESIFPVEKSRACEDSQIKTKFIVKWKDGHISVESAESREDFIEKHLIPEIDAIEHVEHDHVVHLIKPQAKKVQPKQSQWNWGQEMIRASNAWARNVKGEGVIVAVIDSGVDIGHDQLTNQLAYNEAELYGRPGVDDDGDGYIDNISGWDYYSGGPLTGDHQIHGTHVAGIILADHTQGDIKGIAPAAKLLPLAFLGPDGSGETSHAVMAIRYAASHGARVINASWGGSSCSPILKETIAALAEQNILFVAAAGNEGMDIDQYPTFPASFSRMNVASQLTVGASTDIDWQAGFSNEGYNSVHLLAPGMFIMSTLPQQSVGSLDGTSMATPFVAGAAALLWSARPRATLYEIKEAILNGVDTGEFVNITRGRLNVEKSLDYLENHVAP